MSRSLRIAAVFSAVAALSTPAHATKFFSLHAGAFDATRASDGTAQFTIEWRGETFWQGLLPVIGGSINADEGMYGYAGLNYDWQFTPNWYLTPGIAAGAWREGDSLDLGGTLEFRSSLELAYSFDTSYRLGARVEHISNFDIHDRNPGETAALFTFSVPISY